MIINSVEIKIGDCLEVLQTMPDQSVNCCVTSPPYYGLRDYGTVTWEGGDAKCDHKKVSDAKAAITTSTLCGGKKTTGHLQEGFKDFCGKCGARRIDKQIGLEQTPQEYIKKLVSVFAEVHRVLKDDGTLWVNIGDSYAGSWGNAGGHNRGNGTQRKIKTGSLVKDQDNRNGNFVPPGASGFKGQGIKPKDLIGIPWMLAFALRDFGWYLRQDIIWAKTCAMPESVTDRCTKAHEYIFLLSKSERYYFDQESIKEKMSDSSKSRMIRGVSGNHKNTNGAPGQTPHSFQKARLHGEITNIPTTRNKRSVWIVNPKPFKGSHFAVFPPDLIRPCVRAGCPKDGVVLDPFAGSGTTGQVAIEEGRNAILIELNPEYGKIIEDRIEKAQEQPNLF